VKDIETYEDCLFLIEKFYEKLVIDEKISHFFVSLPLATHIPNVADFWAFILLDKPGYSNNMMQAHVRLELKPNDFDQWLKLFHETIDKHFEGNKANLAKERSTLIAWTMRSKL
jgi:hemoglobin